MDVSGIPRMIQSKRTFLKIVGSIKTFKSLKELKPEDNNLNMLKHKLCKINRLNWYFFIYTSFKI